MTDSENTDLKNRKRHIILLVTVLQPHIILLNCHIMPFVVSVTFLSINLMTMTPVSKLTFEIGTVLFG